MEPHRFTLPNGLRVVLEENRSANVVALEAWVNVGSASEAREAAGIAHVFEHMLFKGTKRRAVGAIARDVEGAGGDINAWTSFDETVYHLVLPSRHLELGLDILSDVLQHSTFDGVELRRELEVVLEELKQGQDDPAHVASQALFATAYTKHPYRHPIIGTARSVRALTRQRLLAHFRSHYVASNITLVLCGDLDPGRARVSVEKHFGGMRRGKRHAVDPIVEPRQTAPRAKVIDADVSEAQLQLAFRIPSVSHADAPALELLALVLGNGESSRLERELRRARGLVNEVFAYAHAPRDPGLFVVGATVPPAALDAAIDGIVAQALRLAEEPVSDEELRRAVAALVADGVYERETMQGRARKLGYFETTGGGGAAEELYVRTASTRSAADLKRVAATWFTPENASIVVVARAKDAPSPAQLVARLRRAAQPTAKKFATQRPHHESGVVTLPSGARLVVVPDRAGVRSGLVAMRAAFLGGQRNEDRRRAGIGNLTAQLLGRGTKTRTGDAIQREVEGLAGALAGFPGRDIFGMSGEFLAADAGRGLELLADCLLHPSFPATELEEERRRVLEQLRAEADHPSSLVFRHFHEALFPDHPYGQPLLGDVGSVEGLTRRALLDWHARHMRPEQMVLAVVGDVDPRYIVERCQQVFPAARAKARAPRSANAPSIAPPAASGPRRIFVDADRRQAHLVYGFPGTTSASPDQVGLRVLAAVLGGQSGRLFLELRDTRGLAYRVSASSIDGIDPGYFAVYVATSPGNLDVVEAVIEDQLAALRDTLVGSDELASNKRFLVGSHELALERRAVRAASLAGRLAYGLGGADHERYAQRIEAVTATDLRRLARTYLDRARAVIAVVGKPR